MKSKIEIWQGHRHEPTSGLRKRSEKHWSFKAGSRQRIAALASGWRGLAKKLDAEKRERQEAIDLLSERIGNVPNTFSIGRCDEPYAAEIMKRGRDELAEGRLTFNESLRLVAWIIVQAQLGNLEVLAAVNIVERGQ